MLVAYYLLPEEKQGGTAVSLHPENPLSDRPGPGGEVEIRTRREVRGLEDAGIGEGLRAAESCEHPGLCEAIGHQDVNDPIGVGEDAWSAGVGPDVAGDVGPGASPAPEKGFSRIGLALNESAGSVEVAVGGLGARVFPRALPGAKRGVLRVAEAVPGVMAEGEERGAIL